MKKILTKLKVVNKMIFETEASIKEINDWNELMCSPGEKETELKKYTHWLGELNESKAKVLVQLIVCATGELETLQSYVKAA